jgi:hypothetical protein
VDGQRHIGMVQRPYYGDAGAAAEYPDRRKGPLNPSDADLSAREELAPAFPEPEPSWGSKKLEEKARRRVVGFLV